MVKVKICGLTSIKDYNLTVENRADFTGFIFYEGSKRYIEPAKVQSIIKNGSVGDNLKVGVFVNENICKIQRIWEYCNLDIVQLHGEESLDYCQNLLIPYWKVFRVGNGKKEINYQKYQCKTILFDTFQQKSFGGTGRSFNQNLISRALKSDRQVIVAGGVSLQNIESLCKLNPYALDINSSVEIVPGKKDPEKLRQVLKKLNQIKSMKELYHE